MPDINPANVTGGFIFGGGFLKGTLVGPVHVGVEGLYIISVDKGTPGVTTSFLVAGGPGVGPFEAKAGGEWSMNPTTADYHGGVIVFMGHENFGQWQGKDGWGYYVATSGGETGGPVLGGGVTLEGPSPSHLQAAYDMADMAVDGLVAPVPSAKPVPAPQPSHPTSTPFNVPNVTPNPFVDAFREGMTRGALGNSSAIPSNSSSGTTFRGTPGTAGTVTPGTDQLPTFRVTTTPEEIRFEAMMANGRSRLSTYGPSPFSGAAMFHTGLSRAQDSLREKTQEEQLQEYLNRVSKQK